MLRTSRNWVLQRTWSCRRNYIVSGPLLQKVPSTEEKDPKIHANGLYYGKFTEEEYNSAAKYVKTQLKKLENDIKGETNVRENIGNYPIIPLPADPSKKVKIETLSDLLSETIKTNGPLSLLAYMRQCLTHPHYGYYTTNNPLDQQTGDFITSPEISSVFGEMIGIWLFNTWLVQGKPQQVRILEFGPGMGTLMSDVVRTFNKLAKSNVSARNIEICFIEASPVLRNKQAELLCASSIHEKDLHGSFYRKTSIWGNSVTWYDTEKDIPDIPSTANYVLAHEFFDALPIKSFQKSESGWRELLVEHSPSVLNTQKAITSGGTETIATPELETEFHLTVASQDTPSSLIPEMSDRFRKIPTGTRIEICPDAEFFALKIASLINNEKLLGAALLIDYGTKEGVPSNSLRGIYKHKFVSPFYAPGSVDLSVDVDFENLQAITAKACLSFGPVDQGDWLHEMGIGYRVDQLIKANTGNDEAQERVYNSYRRLTDKDGNGMGGAYKFLCLVPQGSEIPIGFTAS